MAERQRTSAEEAERARRRKWFAVLGVSMVAGFSTGIGFAASESGEGFLEGRIPAPLAIGFAALYLIMMIFGTIAMKRVTDEVEVHNNLYGMAVGGSMVMLAYPPWWMLWRGDVVREPSHEALFLLLFLSAIAAYLWKKYR
jgi:hypothetical protein